MNHHECLMFNVAKCESANVMNSRSTVAYFRICVCVSKGLGGGMCKCNHIICAVLHYSLIEGMCSCI